MEHGCCFVGELVGDAAVLQARDLEALHDILIAVISGPVHALQSLQLYDSLCSAFFLISIWVQVHIIYIAPCGFLYRLRIHRSLS
jgi:hypothetical protein